MDSISIIVPIYNTEKYLPKCIESLIAQTYKNIEIILVNDGSKDNSIDICREYEQKDNRIIVIDKINEGVSIARNTGIEKASGKYIGFMDPDDWIEPNMYERLYNKAIEVEAPITLCNYYKDTKNRSTEKRFPFKKEIIEGEEIITKLVNSMVGMEDIRPTASIMGCVWRGLFDTDFLNKHNLRFAKGLTIMEDLVFMIQALLCCDKVAIEKGAYYHYIQNPSSALHSYNEKLWDDQLMVYELLEDSFIRAGLEEKMQNRLDIRYIGMVVSSIKNETYMKKNSDLKGAVSHIRQICQDEKLKIILDRVKPIQVPEKAVLETKQEKDMKKIKGKEAKEKEKQEKERVKKARKERVKLEKEIEKELKISKQRKESKTKLGMDLKKASIKQDTARGYKVNKLLKGTKEMDKRHLLGVQKRNKTIESKSKETKVDK